MANKKGMATGVEVARISVKVSPDTRKFRSELHDDLQDIERKEKIDLKDVEVDTSKAQKKVKNLSDSADGLSKKKIKISADIGDMDKVLAQMKANMNRLDLKWDAKVQKFKFEQSGFNQKLEIAQIRSERNRIMQEFEVTYDQVRAGQQRLEQLMRPKDLSRFNPNVIRAKFRDWFGVKPLEIPITYTQGKKGGKGSNGLPGIGDDVAKNGNLLSKLTPNFGTGLNPAGYAAILGGILLVAQPLLGIITAAITALPGLIGLIAAPIAAVTLGLDGFKKAGEAIKPQFDQLRATMAQVAELSFTPVLQEVANTIFPMLEKHLPNVTKGLANFAQGAVDAFKDPNNAAKFEGSIDRIGAAFHDMRPGLDGFVSGIIGLIDQFSLKLPAITEWFNKTGTDFNNWVQRMSHGELSTSFDQLGAFIRKVLDLLSELGTKSMDFMSTPGSLDGFIATLDKVGEAIQKVIDLSASLNEKWQGIVQVSRGFNAITDLMQGDGSGALANLKDMFANKPWNGAQEDARNLAAETAKVGKEAEISKQKFADLITGSAAGAVQPATPNNPIDALQQQITETPPVQPPDLEPAKAAVSEYQTFVDEITQQVRGSLSAATTGDSLPAPNFEAFKAAWRELPGIVTSGINDARQASNEGAIGIADGFKIAGNLIVAQVQQWPGAIAGALASCYQIGLNAGNQVSAGMANGISAGTPFIVAAATNAALAAKQAAESALGIKSPSRVFMQIGNYTAEGMGIGMEKGFAPVINQAKELAGKIADAFANGGDPTGSLDGFTNKEVSRMEKVLSFEAKRLEMQAKALDYQAKSTGNEALKARAQELRMQKDQITMQKDMLDLTQEYADLQNPGGGQKLSDNPFVQSIQELMKVPGSFAQAASSQFLGDMGISGGGALGALADYGMNLGTNFIFNVSNVDDAMAVHRNQVNKQSQGIVGR